MMKKIEQEQEEEGEKEVSHLLKSISASILCALQCVTNIYDYKIKQGTDDGESKAK